MGLVAKGEEAAIDWVDDLGVQGSIGQLDGLDWLALGVLGLGLHIDAGVLIEVHVRKPVFWEPAKEIVEVRPELVRHDVLGGLQGNGQWDGLDLGRHSVGAPHGVSVVGIGILRGVETPVEILGQVVEIQLRRIRGIVVGRGVHGRQGVGAGEQESRLRALSL